MKLSSAGLIKYNDSNTNAIYGLYTKYAANYEICALITLSNFGIYRRFFESNIAKKYIVFEESFLDIKSLCKQYKNVEFVEINTKTIIESISNYLEKRKNMKFDLSIMNPPYGKPKEGTSSNLHYDITEYVKNNSKETCSVQPIRMITSSSEKFEEYKTKYDINLVNIEELNSNVFENTNMSNVAIFHWNENKTEKNIIVSLLDKEYKVSSLNNLDLIFTNYEKKFMTILKNDNPNYNGYKPTGENKEWNINGENYFDDYAKKHNFKENEFYVLLSMANGSKLGQGIALSSKDKTHICNSLSELKTYCKETNNATKVFAKFSTKKAAKNYVNAIQRPLLRFGLVKMQDDQNMTERVYKYIPDIDWSNDKTNTDKGILEMCGFSNKDSKEFTKYCENYIANIDNKESK